MLQTRSCKVATSCNVQVLFSNTYDHRTLKTRLPVRSALFKQRTGGLVVGWVTTSESPLLYVFFCSFGVWILLRTLPRQPLLL